MMSGQMKLRYYWFIHMRGKTLRDLERMAKDKKYKRMVYDVCQCANEPVDYRLEQYLIQ